MKKSEVRLKKLKVAPNSAGTKTDPINRPTPHPREGWREAFRQAGASDRVEPLLAGVGPNAFDLEEWEW